MTFNAFEQSMLESAEETDRKLTPQRMVVLKNSYQFFKELGLTDNDIKMTMALTTHEMQQIRN